MPDFGVNLGHREWKKKMPKINENLKDQILIFLELVHLGLYSGKVWENSFFFSFLHTFSRSLQKTARNYVVTANRGLF